MAWLAGGVVEAWSRGGGRRAGRRFRWGSAVGEPGLAGVRLLGVEESGGEEAAGEDGAGVRAAMEDGALSSRTSGVLQAAAGLLQGAIHGVFILALTIAVLALLAAAIWAFLPAVQGYHLGCDVLIDHLRLVRLGLEWCK
jgi:hypothetical protein